MGIFLCKSECLNYETMGIWGRVRSTSCDSPGNRDEPEMSRHIRRLCPQQVVGGEVVLEKRNLSG